MDMDWVTLSAAAAIVWGAVRVFGNERQRRLDLIEAEAAAEYAAIAAAQTHNSAPAAIPVVHSPH
ncbi:MAG: hypothetical protein QM754_14905 [Tepidisphaeraceae bacterium]